jgi:hypothetical protein
MRLCHLVSKSELSLIAEFCCRETIATNIVANGNGVDKHCTSTVHTTSDDYTPSKRALRVRHTSSRQACGRSTESVHRDKRCGGSVPIVCLKWNLSDFFFQ